MLRGEITVARYNEENTAAGAPALVVAGLLTAVIYGPELALAALRHPAATAVAVKEATDFAFGLVTDAPDPEGVGGGTLGQVVGRLGDDAAGAVAKSAYQVAKEGGKHAGFLRNYAGKSADELERGIASIERQIAEHRDKIANPEKYIPNFRQLDPRQQAALTNIKWPPDIQRQSEQLDILRGLRNDH